MDISISGKNRLGIAQMISSLNSDEPNWSVIPTAGKRNKSQAQFVSEIKDLAQKAAMAANKTESEYISRLGLKLRAEYLANVAPDRKFLYQQAKNAIKNQSGRTKCQGSGELTLLDFLEEAEGKISNLADRKFALAGGGTLICPMLTGGGYGVEIFYQGAMVLANLGNGWGYEPTPAELEKLKEFNDIYWNEYRSVKNSEKTDMQELPDYLEDKPAFDRKA